MSDSETDDHTRRRDHRPTSADADDGPSPDAAAGVGTAVGTDPAGSTGTASATDTGPPGTSSQEADAPSTAGSVTSGSGSGSDRVAGEDGSSDDGTEGGAPARRRLGRVPAWLVPTAVVGAVVALPLWGMWIAPGPPMEEGFMLVFPERLLEGEIPHRDFLHLYGPGSLWVLAGAFKALGVDLWVERLVGLVQILALVGGVTYVSHRWGRWVAVAGGSAAAIVIMPAIGLTALAWVGGVALGLWATILAARALDPDLSPAGVPDADGASDRGTDTDPPAGPARHDRRRRRTLVLAGLLAGFALLYRPDLVLALGLPLGAMWLWALDRPGRRQLLGGVVAGVSPYLVHLALAGPVTAFEGMVVEPVVDLRPGRSLGFPPSWDSYDSFLNKAFAFRDWSWPLPTPAGTNQVFLWVPLLLASYVVLLGVGVYARRAGSREGWRVLALALFALGCLPQALQRPDTAHLAWVSAVPFGLVPLAVAEWLRLRRPAGAPRLLALGAALPLVLMLLVIPNYTVRWYADYVGQTFGYRREGNELTNRGRTFYHGREPAAVATRELLGDVEELTDPGDRLIVGPGSFRFTPYSEVHLYFLLPQLEPATHYIEMDPGVANAEDSGLADELREADVVILSTIYDDWEEPNASRDPGSDEPDQVLAEEFCLHSRYGTNEIHQGRGLYELYLRC